MIHFGYGVSENGIPRKLLFQGNMVINQWMLEYPIFRPNHLGKLE